MARAALMMALVLVAANAAAQSSDGLNEVRALYEGASYEEALTRLSEVAPAQPSALVEQYRAFCLIALGRVAEASGAVARAVEADPELVPADNAASPRVRSFFAETRRKLLPDIIKGRYATAKAAYSAKNFAAAKAGFGQVITLADSLGTDGSEELKDLRLLAASFLELSQQPSSPASTPAPQVRVPAPQATTPPVIRPATAISQEMPVWSRTDLAVPLTGEVHLKIDETGAVTSAVITKATDPRYDAQLLAAARTWRYQPALRDGQPLASEKTITFVLRARR